MTQEQMMVANRELYETSSMLRGYARLFRGNDSTERYPVMFNAVEADGVGTALIGLADKLDALRDSLD